MTTKSDRPAALNGCIRPKADSTAFSRTSGARRNPKTRRAPEGARRAPHKRTRQNRYCAETASRLPELSKCPVSVLNVALVWSIVAVVDPEVHVAGFELAVLAELVADAERKPGAVAVRNARRARESRGRRLVVGDAGAQCPVRRRCGSRRRSSRTRYPSSRRLRASNCGCAGIGIDRRRASRSSTSACSRYRRRS